MAARWPGSRDLLSSYRAVGADGVVLGFLNGHTEVDADVVTEIVGEHPDFPWTFHRAVDACISSNRAWRELRLLPGLDQVLTAGSARGVSEGLDDLVARARVDAFARTVIMAGGGLLPEHVPWLARVRRTGVPDRCGGPAAGISEGLRRPRSGSHLAQTDRPCDARGSMLQAATGS